MPYCVVIKHYLYGPTYKKELLAHGNGKAQIFDSLTEAREATTVLNSARYSLAPGEYSSPEYTATNVNRLPQYLRNTIW